MYTIGWVVAPIVLFLIWKNIWLTWIQICYARKVQWITLELKIPHNVERTPKVMEQVFAGIHAAHKPNLFFSEKWWEGKHQLYISMEIVGIGGAIHFFIRTPIDYKKMIVSQIYSQYKEAEINDVSDYMNDVPLDIPNEEYEMSGMELQFTKPDPYPIRTYRFFEELATEKRHIDPLSALVEVLGGLKPGEQVWTQYVIKPIGNEWHAGAQRLIDKMMGKKDTKKTSSHLVEEVFQFFYDLATAIVVDPVAQSEKKDEKETRETLMLHLSPGARDVVAALEESMSKFAFETVIRIIYIAKRDIFDNANLGSTFGTFKQFSTYNLNGLKPNSAISTPAVSKFFKKTRTYLRKRRLYKWARDREFIMSKKQKKMILNIEELATIYHIPSVVLETPMLSRIPAKKSEPPAHLPVI